MSRSVRICDWCKDAIPDSVRADAICCSTRCRQARHRFRGAVGVGSGHGRRIRLAYGDPPYPGLSKKYYGDHPDYAGEVDHAELIRTLCSYDGWALSTSAKALPEVLALCPPGVRVAAWHRGERPTRSGGPLNAWEPVIYSGGRVALGSALDTSRGSVRRVDSLVFHSRPRLTDPDRVVGAKPATFSRWMFDLLGAQPQDEFTDIFAGSGGVMRAWDVFAGGAE